MARLRLLIVDDSAMYRQALKNIISDIPGVECIGTASDGREAMDKIEALQPDVVTLDMEMPVMSGIEVIKLVVAKKLSTRLIVVSSCSQSGAEGAINALKLGAYDFITKPARLGGGTIGIKEQLTKILGALNCADVVNNRVKSSVVPRIEPMSALPIRTSVKLGIMFPRPQAIVIGSSTGGPKALLELFSGFKKMVGVPLFIVQHMPPLFTKTLAKSINDVSQVNVKEAEDGDRPQPNHAYIAPGGRQMKLVMDGDGVLIRITDDPSSNFCKPSVDYFFDSVAEVYKGRTLGVILSGMGADGAIGLQKIKQRGGRVFGQDEQSCVVYGMPRVAMEVGAVDEQVGIGLMSRAIESVFH